MLPQSYLWLPVALALLAAILIFLWLVTRPHLLETGLGGVLPAEAERIPSAHEAQVQTTAGILSPVFTPEVLAWGQEIERWAEAYDLDPNLVATVMQIESCGHPSVLSSSGAIGLFQVMPFHFQAGEDPMDPETNARRGLNYLSQALGLSAGRTDLALAGYNGGHGVIGQQTSRWPAETQRYVTWGGGILNDIAGGHSTSPSLQGWLRAGGDNLCRRASVAIASFHSANAR